MAHCASARIEFGALKRTWQAKALAIQLVQCCGVPYGSRTRVAAVKGRCPRPLDERDALSASLTGKRTCYGNVGEKVVSNREVSRNLYRHSSFLHLVRTKCLVISPRSTKPHETLFRAHFVDRSCSGKDNTKSNQGTTQISVEVIRGSSWCNTRLTLISKTTNRESSN